MTLTLTHAIAGVLVSGTVLVVMIILAYRSTRTVHPVRCAHCRNYHERETIITYAEEENQWGICPECIHHYWQFTHPSKED